MIQLNAADGMCKNWSEYWASELGDTSPLESNARQE
jgi:hypothetical protein